MYLICIATLVTAALSVPINAPFSENVANPVLEAAKKASQSQALKIPENLFKPGDSPLKRIRKKSASSKHLMTLSEALQMMRGDDQIASNIPENLFKDGTSAVSRISRQPSTSKPKMSFSELQRFMTDNFEIAGKEIGA
jgi:hypothetical protein